MLMNLRGEENTYKSSAHSVRTHLQSLWFISEENVMKYKYIDSIPKPLLKDFFNSKVIPIVGAGFSKNADIPEGLTMPDWNELGARAADEIPGYDYNNNAIDALSYYEDLYSRVKLVELLLSELHFGEIQPGDTYKAFCKLFTGTICTTNFDSLIEDTFTMLHQPVSVVVTKDRLTVGSKNERRIIKLHGDFNHPDKMVITEHDYDVYLDENPIFATYIANLFISNTMLLIGYSLDDNDFRSVWQIINSRLGNMSQPAYCITVGASPEKIARYNRRNIRVINLEGKGQDYKTILRDFFIEIRDYVDNQRDKIAKSTDEKVNEQMIIPAEDNRLCFISCAMSRISQLSALLYPILYKQGITPVRIDDMLMPSDNWIDVSQTAIRKSKAAIIDISDSSSSVMLELGLIKSIKSEKNILLICEKGTVLPISLMGYSVLNYTFDMTCEEDTFKFNNSLSEWVCNVFNVFSKKNGFEHPIFEDAYKLFEKGEYSASIISAYSVLEHLVCINNPDIAPDYTFYHYLLKCGNDLKQDFGYHVDDILDLRNVILHCEYKAIKKEAKVFIELLKAIYDSYNGRKPN